MGVSIKGVGIQRFEFETMSDQSKLSGIPADDITNISKEKKYQLVRLATVGPWPYRVMWLINGKWVVGYYDMVPADTSYIILRYKKGVERGCVQFLDDDELSCKYACALLRWFVRAKCYVFRRRKSKKYQGAITQCTTLVERDRGISELTSSQSSWDNKNGDWIEWDERKRRAAEKYDKKHGPHPKHYRA